MILTRQGRGFDPRTDHHFAVGTLYISSGVRGGYREFFSLIYEWLLFWDWRWTQASTLARYGQNLAAYMDLISCQTLVFAAMRHLVLVYTTGHTADQGRKSKKHHFRRLEEQLNKHYRSCSQSRTNIDTFFVCLLLQYVHE